MKPAILFNLVPAIFLPKEDELATIKDELLFWKDDLPFPKSLDQELRRWEDLWKRKKTSPFGYDQEQLPTVNIPDNFLLSLTACDSHSFPNIHRLLIIGCTLPITSAEAERTFSLMRRIKTFARSTMCEERFADLGVIAMNYGERITVDDVARAFVEKNPRRLFDASLFTADEKHYN